MIMSNDFTMFMAGCFVGCLLLGFILGFAYDKYSAIETIKNKNCIIYKEEIYCKVSDEDE